MVSKVLIVDDSDIIHNMYRIMFKKYPDCKTVSATNGQDGLDTLYRESGFDLILLDINMPIMNGLQFLEVQQKDPRISHVPVIIISTEGKEEDTLRGLSMGASGYIVKPFKSMDLHKMIESVVQKKAAQG